MKSVFRSLLLVLAASATAFCQDTIVRKNGDEVPAKVSEITGTEIKYKKFDNLDGPTYTLLKSEVLFIRYQNGTKEMISAEQPGATPTAAAADAPDPTARRLVLLNQKSGKRRVYKELNTVTLKYRTEAGQVLDLTGVLADIRENLLVVNTTTIPLSSVVQFRIYRSGKRKIAALGLGCYLGALLGYIEYKGPSTLSTVAILTGTSLAIVSACIKEKLPIGTKYVLLIETVQ